MDNTAYLYTEQLHWYPKFKQGIKRLLGKENRGPQAVLTSLTQGLQSLGRPFLINRYLNKPIHAAYIVSGVKTLEWAISQKKRGLISKIVAGPNIIVSPHDSNGIISDPAVDVVAVPSEWVKDFYIKAEPLLTGRVKIWPAGVEVPPPAGLEKKLDFLIYNKLGAASQLAKNICSFLTGEKNTYVILDYGTFKQQDYFKLLEQCKGQIYLSQSESQGLAMFEAWARAVPTLVWQNNVFEKDGITVTGKISAPYLADASGMSFTDFDDFKNKLSAFASTNFHPREYVEQYFTNASCAQKYVDLSL